MLSSPTEPALPALARSTLNRAAHRRRDTAWLDDAWRRARVLVVADGRVLLVDGRLLLLSASQAEPFATAK